MTVNRAKKNVVLLALCQALAMTGNTVLITVAALIGYSLAADKSLATVPLALQQLATMGATIPASMLMKRLGRQPGFIIGGADEVYTPAEKAKTQAAHDFIIKQIWEHENP